MSDSYTVTPSFIIQGDASIPVNISYTSSNFATGTPYTIKTAKNLTLDTETYSFNPVGFNPLWYAGFDSSNNYYIIVDYGNPTGQQYVFNRLNISKINVAGITTANIVINDNTYLPQFNFSNNKPLTVAVNSNGTKFYVGWQTSTYIIAYNLPSGTLISTYSIDSISSLSASFNYSFQFFTNFVVGPTDGHLYYKNRNGSISRFNTTTNTYSVVSTLNPSYPFAIDNSNNMLYSTTFYNGTVNYVILNYYSPSGTFIKQIQGPNLGSGSASGGVPATFYNSSSGYTYIVWLNAKTNIYVGTYIFMVSPTGTFTILKRPEDLQWTTLICSYVQPINAICGNNNNVYSLLPITLNFTVSATNLGSQDTNLYLYNGSTPFGIPIAINVTCFLEGTQILCKNKETGDAEYVPIETLRKGDLIKTISRGYIPIHTIGKFEIYNPGKETKIDNRLFKLTPDKCPELFEDLYITGNHCILYTKLDKNLRFKVFDHMNDIYVTEGYYRVPACLDERALPYEEEGPATIWHFALENDNIYENYGVFANGLLVESSSIRYMTELSNMELL